MTSQLDPLKAAALVAALVCVVAAAFPRSPATPAMRSIVIAPQVAAPHPAKDIHWHRGALVDSDRDRPVLVLFGDPGAAVWSDAELVEFVGCTFECLHESMERAPEWEAAFRQAAPESLSGAMTVTPPCLIVCTPEADLLTLAIAVPGSAAALLKTLEEALR